MWKSKLFLESNYADILAQCEEIRMTQLILAIFLWGGYFPLFSKESVIHMHGLAVYVKEGLLFTQELSLENSVDSY